MSPINDGNTYDGPLVLDTDQARGLSSVWRLSDTSRILYSAAVQTPAAAFVSDMYANAVKGRANGYVLFMAGGGGAGKTAAVAVFTDSSPLLIYDTTFSHAQSAFKNVRLALENGRNVVIIYVHRPFQNAVRGVIARAILTSRVVPLKVLARDHVESPRTVLQIAKKFMSDNDVNVYVFDNSGNDPAEGKFITDKEETLSFLENMAYNDTDDFERQAREVLNDETAKGDLPELIVRAFQ